MDDAQQLASLVLLLRLPLSNHGASSTGESKSVGNHASRALCIAGGGSSGLRDALERNDCELLCFVVRVIRQYTKSSSPGGGSLSAAYAHLRLAVRIAFLRYASFDECERHDVANGNIDSQRQCVWEYERYLLDSLLEALRIRSTDEMEEVDVESGWVVQRLLAKLSKHDMQSKTQKQNQLVSRMWTETIDTLALCRQQTKSEGSPSLSVTDATGEGSAHNLNDEQLMIKTIHTILDRNNDSEINQDDGSIHHDWNLQFNTSLVSCIQTFLQEFSEKNQTAPGSGKAHFPLWTGRALFEMIKWSQQNQALSKDIYWLTSQYLRLCVFGLSSGQPSLQRGGLEQFYSNCVAQENKTRKDSNMNHSVDEFADATRSFLFYGLIILSNADHSPNMMKAETHTRQAPQISNSASSATMRVGIYSLVLNLWQLFGTGWLSVPQSTTSTSSDWWWFQSGDKRDEEHRLGPMWPLCTLISLAAGEFRLGLGRWMAIVEDGNEDSPGDYAELVAEIHCFARIIAEAVQLMTSIAEDEDAMARWSPDAILHIRKSLEDALNSSVQYFNALSQGVKNDDLMKESSCCHKFSEQQEEVGQTCCVVMGTIAAELEAEYLLATPSAGIQNSHVSSGENSASSFAHALLEGIIFCHSLGERQLSEIDRDSRSRMAQRPYEYREPLTHLMPCIMSLISKMTGNENESIAEQMHHVLAALNKDDCLIISMLSFLYRASKHWNSCLEGAEELSRVDDSVLQQLDGVISLVKICALIIDELTKIVKCSSEKIPLRMPDIRHRLCLSLELWEKILNRSSCKWPSQMLRSNAAQALNQVTHCLSILEL